MLLVFPTTSAIFPGSYGRSYPYEHYPSREYYPHHHAPQFTIPSYPSYMNHLRQPSAEELEEHEYRQAVEVIANHRRLQAKKHAAIRRQQLAEAARQRYFAGLAAELEQRRQGELLAARRAELFRARQTRERLVAAERQHAIDAFLRQLSGPQPLTRQPHVVKRKPLADRLKERLATETDTDIADAIKNILPSLEARSIESERPKEPSEGTSESSEEAAKVVESLLSSIFPGLVRTHQQPSSVAQKPQSSASDKGKGKSRAVGDEASQGPAPESKCVDEASVEIPRHIMDPSKRTPSPSKTPSSPSSEPTVTGSEQVQADLAVALSSIENVQDTLTKLQADFVLPTELDHYTPSTDDHDETASISSVSSDLTKLIPFTHNNKPVYKYENELNGLLDELDRIDSRGDAEVREKRKEVVKAIERALEDVEQVVGEAVEKRLSSISPAPADDEPLEGHDVEEDVAEEAVPAQEQVDALGVDDSAVTEPPVLAQVEEGVVTPTEVTPPAEEPLFECDIRVTPRTPTDPTSIETDFEAPTEAITLTSIEPGRAAETADTFLLPGRSSPPSPVQKSQETDSDSDVDHDVLSLDSEAEKSDWSEIED